MAIRCKNCGRDYDITLFQFGRSVRCECGNRIFMENKRVQEKPDDDDPQASFARPAPTRLILVRHGETDWNRDSRIQGQLGTDLNEIGRQEARLVAERLADYDAENLLSSDLARAMQTARPIAEQTGLEIIEEPKLREANFGEWEGKTFAEIEEEAPETALLRAESSLRDAPPGGESAAQLQERTIGCLNRVIREYPHQTSILVTHGGPCKFAIAHVLGLNKSGIYRFAVDNASINIIEIGVAGWRLVTLNDTAHLQKHGMKQDQLRWV